MEQSKLCALINMQKRIRCICIRDRRSDVTIALSHVAHILSLTIKILMVPLYIHQRLRKCEKKPIKMLNV